MYAGLKLLGHMQYEGIVYMPCNPANSFFPDISVAKDCDLIMFCNPNNPTGTLSPHTLVP